MFYLNLVNEKDLKVGDRYQILGDQKNQQYVLDELLDDDTCSLTSVDGTMSLEGPSSNLISFVITWKLISIFL